MKKATLEKILCIFLIACPLLDVLSFIFRNFFGTSISPSTFLRPIIPMILITYIFFKNKGKIKLQLFLAFLIYSIYGLMHLFLVNSIRVESSYGSIIHEAQYITNYSYMILNLFIYWFVFKNKETTLLKNSIFISISIYIFFISLSILTGTSSSTYVEGEGIKGWFESGNSLSSILVLSIFILLPLKEALESNIKTIILLILVGLFLMLYIGTRVRSIWIHIKYNHVYYFLRIYSIHEKGRH